VRIALRRNSRNHQSTLAFGVQGTHEELNSLIEHVCHLNRFFVEIEFMVTRRLNAEPAKGVYETSVTAICGLTLVSLLEADMGSRTDVQR
jgi:hypothetical protein